MASLRSGPSPAPRAQRGIAPVRAEPGPSRTAWHRSGPGRARPLAHSVASLRSGLSPAPRAQRGTLSAVEHLELVVFGVLLATAGLAVLSRIVGVPYPITLVLGGCVIGFVPGVPDVELDPDLVLLIFLPPLLYGAAFFTSLRDLRANARPIALLSIGMVIVTMGAVAVVAHEAIGLGWGEAFVIGA